MTIEDLNQFDVCELTEDINPNLRMGMRGTVLEKYDEDHFEIEVLDRDGHNIGFDNQFTFTVSKNQIRKIA